jgi:hypothetical protein
MPSSTNQRIGELVRRGVLLFAGSVPVPGSTFIAAIAAAALSKTMDLRDSRVSEVLGRQLELPHVPYVEPDDEQLLAFYRSNPLHPRLAGSFREEIASRDCRTLREFYPWLYGALVLKRDLPAILFHSELEAGEYRQLAVKYRDLAAGYEGILGKANVDEEVDRFAGDLLQVLNEIYAAGRAELLNKQNREAFDLIDFIKEVALT